MTTLNLVGRLDPCAATPLPLDTSAGLPGFGDPWHAQVFGTAMALSRAGLFDWAQWVDTFSAEINAHPQSATETSEVAYYRQWLSALETILARSGAMTAAEIAQTAEHWRRSYLNTPHGRPIELSRDWHEPHDHDHDHDHHRHGHARPQPQPVTVDPARA